MLFVRIHNAARSQMAAALDDPAGQPTEVVRVIPDRIRDRIQILIRELLPVAQK